MGLKSSAITVAGLGSAALLAGAFAFQYIGGLHPCQLCLWQRWPHAAAVVILLAWAVTRWRIWPWLGALAALATAGIGFFHAGVEQGWWEFASTCTQGSVAGISASDLMNPGLASAPVIRCDAIAWSFIGLSMAAWNAIASLGLAFLWLFAASRRD
ncbi:disulfide bond formation protein B [Xinfangfangia sp. D13-10-4-6]|uniref:disulfide bond formation protein B n=1 Tax=Pseudogemmobacter hezensis TaxID=2737662 RepID=UPI001551E941|nr:disulfide bond formation protein B [Pseudogemmobacter hezensis]NPD15594.1 disulfide bond formation protein B [Pseudogemmobacter hezensis]